MKKKTLKKAKSTTQKAKLKKNSNPAKKLTAKFGKAVSQNVESIAERIVGLFSNTPTDLISAIEQDHDGLRQFIDALKDTKRDMTERRRAYELFSALLKSHTIAEEDTVYTPIRKTAKSDLIIRIEEGFVEHQVTKEIMARMDKTNDHYVWSAHANVLAELIEHHLDEEEEKMFPLMRKTISKKMEAELIMQYLQSRAVTQKKVTTKNAGVLEVLK